MIWTTNYWFAGGGGGTFRVGFATGDDFGVGAEALALGVGEAAAAGAWTGVVAEATICH